MCHDCENEEKLINKYEDKIQEVLVLKENSLYLKHPELLDEWDWEENDKNGINPFDVSFGSGKKVSWICCTCKEAYKAIICDKTREKSKGCPYCAGQKVCLGNCLATLRPDIAKEWDEIKNKTLTPFNVTFSSHKKVSWICSNCNEKYDATINHRTRENNPTSCPYCDGKKVCFGNCLATLRPDLACQWHPTKNETLTPFDITCFSNKKVWWLCPDCNESYNTIIANRTNMESGCPFCAGKKVCLGNCLATLRSDVAKEWDYDQNKELTPFDVTLNSGKKVYWICSNNSEHKWKARICNRTRKNCPTGCPECRVYYHEILCREIMKEIFNKDFNKYRDITLKNKNNRSLELDCYNEELKINIEYDGEQHFRFVNGLHKNMERFKNGQENDLIKDQWCKDNNILQIRVSYKYDTKEEIENYIKDQLTKYGKL